MYTVRIFMKCTHACAAQKAFNSLPNYKKKPDFPSLADEIAEPHPDMNIKVAAFTVSEKSSNTVKGNGLGEGSGPVSSATCFYNIYIDWNLQLSSDVR